MKNKKNRQMIGYAVVGVLLTLLLAGGLTYAFFKNRVDDTKTIDATIKSRTVDTQIFEVDDYLHIYADANNFNETEEATNLTDMTKSKITIRANNISSQVDKDYYVYLKIDQNSFTYTTDKKEPELLLNVFGPDSTEEDGETALADSKLQKMLEEAIELGDIESVLDTTGVDKFEKGDLFGLEYRTVVDKDGKTLSGYDITDFHGIIPITSHYRISSTSAEEEKEEIWRAVVTFVNLPSDQEGNENKLLEGNLIITPNPELVQMTNENTLEQNAGGEQTVEEENIIPLSELCEGKTIEDCFIRYVYKGQSVNGLYYHNSGNHDKYTNSKYEGNDYSLRFAGGDDLVNNWVCFGYTNESSCKADNFTTSTNAYRIIGLFYREVVYTYRYGGSSYERIVPEYNVKLIRQIPIKDGTDNASANRSEVKFNTYNTSLTDSEWMKMVESYYPYRFDDGYSHGFNNGYAMNLKTARTLFDSDMSIGYAGSSGVDASKSSYNTSTPTRLMYASDYGYAASPYYWEAENTWENALSQYTRAVNENENWLYIGRENTKLINGNNDYAWYINTGGNLSQESTGTSSRAVYRPTIYLKHGTLYKSGTGTKEDPYILEYGQSYKDGYGTTSSPYIPTDELVY